MSTITLTGLTYIEGARLRYALLQEKNVEFDDDPFVEVDLELDMELADLSRIFAWACETIHGAAPAEILALSESLRGDSAPSATEGEETAATLTGGFGSRGGRYGPNRRRKRRNCK